MASLLASMASGPLRWLFRGSLPRSEGEFRAPDLDEPASAEIVRDDFGVPHIRAATEADLFFLNGVVHAQDRLWQLHSVRMLASGRLSSFAGDRALDIDRLTRQLGFRHLAKGDLETIQEVAKTDSEVAAGLRMIEAYVCGVNWAVAETLGTLPLEFLATGQRPWEPWTAVDCLQIFRLYSFIMDFGFQQSLLRGALVELFGRDAGMVWANTEERESGIPFTADEEALRAFHSVDLAGAFSRGVDALPRGQGSNWWAIHGSKTESGRPILCGDPHLSVKIPVFWYEVHLKLVTGEGMDTPQTPFEGYGFAPPGVPGILIGHNTFMATSITLGYSDVEDIFLERLRASDGRYLHRGEWKECEHREETIEVKGRSEPERLIVRSTCHGVLLEGPTLMQFDPFKRCVVASTASAAQDGESIQVAYAAISQRPRMAGLCNLRKFFRCRSFQEFDAFLEGVSTLLNLNVAYADIEGHIGFSHIGQVPIRSGARGAELFPLAGWTGEQDWQGFVPHSQLPKLFDPPSGIIISANHKVVDQYSSAYPHYLGVAWKSGYRAQAIDHELQQLLQKGPLSPAQMLDVFMNVRSWAAVAFVEELRSIRPTDTDASEAWAVLTSWDGTLSSDSVAASLYQFAHAELIRLLVEAGCRAVGLPQREEPWTGVDREFLLSVINGASFDASSTLKMVNELQGHVHLNVLRILRCSDGPTAAGLRWWLDQAGGKDRAVSMALSAAVVKLRGLAGRRDWQGSNAIRWGKIHMAHFVHPIATNLGLSPGTPPLQPPSHEWMGDTNTINQACPLSLTDLTATGSMVSLRVMYDLSDLSNAATNRAILPLGQSGQFHSPHFFDQNALWREGRLKPMLIKESDFRATSTRSMHFCGRDQARL